MSKENRRNVFMKLMREERYEDISPLLMEEFGDKKKVEKLLKKKKNDEKEDDEKD